MEHKAERKCKMKLVSVIQTFLLLTAAVIADDDLDQECEASSVCSPSEDCEYYQQQIKNITTVRRTEVKNQILQHLRYLYVF